MPRAGPAMQHRPGVAAEVMREVIAAADAKKKRAFLGAFIERMIVVTAESVTIDYRPEALLSAGWVPVFAVSVGGSPSRAHCEPNRSASIARVSCGARDGRHVR
jgi:hypothetical protein